MLGSREIEAHPTTNPTTPEPPMNPTADSRSPAAHFLAHLTFKLEERKTAQASLAEAVSKDPLYALSWAQNGAIELALGDWYREADARIDQLVEKHGGERQDHAQAGLTLAVRNATRQLLGNEMRGGSSSDFSNAVEAAKREAASRFVRDNEHFAQES